MLKRCFSLLLALFLCGSLCVSAGPSMTASASSLDDYFGEGWEDGLDDALDQVTGAGSDGTGAGDDGAGSFEPVTESALADKLLLKNTASTLAVSDSGLLTTFNGLSPSFRAIRNDSGYLIYNRFFPYSDSELEQYPYVVAGWYSNPQRVRYWVSASPLYFTVSSAGSLVLASSAYNGGSDSLRTYEFSFVDGTLTFRGSSNATSFSGSSVPFFVNFTPSFTSPDAENRVILSDLIRRSATTSGRMFSSSDFVNLSSSDVSIFGRDFSISGYQFLDIAYTLSNPYIDLIYPASDFGITSEIEENRIVFDGSILLDYAFSCMNSDLSSVYLSDLVVDSMSFLVDGEPQGAYSLRYDRAFTPSSSFTLFDSSDPPNPPTSSTGSFNTVAVPVSSSTQTIGFRFYLSGDYQNTFSSDFPLYGNIYDLTFNSWLHLNQQPSSFLTTVVDNGEIVDSIDQLRGDIGQVQNSINQVQNSVNQVQNELSGVNDSVQALPDQIGDKVTGIFVPDISDAETDRSKWENLLASKLGFVYQGYELVDMTVESLRDSADGEAYAFTFPGVSVPIQNVSYEIIKEQEVSLDNKLMSVLRPVLGAILCIVSTLGVFNLMVSMVKCIISGESIAGWLSFVKHEYGPTEFEVERTKEWRRRTRP